ncbi:hypothetical protein ACFJIS_15650 [Variovorax boronicumulans]|uniref:hypothetical protein n=1 Tax=Variovorax boronicumulans TaxID=436515 RepID=UPI0036F3F215
MSFTPPIPRNLAIEVDGFCSRCDVFTGVPDGRASGGNAAHIVAESESFERGKHPMPPYKRAMQHNGIWLCTNCHQLVDRIDPDAFTVEGLLALKQAAIERVPKRRGQSAQVVVNEYARPSAYRASVDSLRGSAHFLDQHTQLRRLLRDANWYRHREITRDVEQQIAILSNVRRTLGLRRADLADEKNFCDDRDLLSLMRSVEQAVNALAKSPAEMFRTRPLEPLRGQIDAYLAATDLLARAIEAARQPPMGEPTPYVPYPR